ncbi:unnamed protein product [Lepeophtheirus salmonis]|uniref:(salmon louse) hypothetical protein n=1 Tax=Lepeophtheirus salmonis TaxID=72036 RepID=A0A7R8HB40_LEPSM|nr:unnamed protein product [Lepeophtheirus salmonis]CAF2968075.1 unnamed protein product [Lepeophtheirus salmonis]
MIQVSRRKIFVNMLAISGETPSQLVSAHLTSSDRSQKTTPCILIPSHCDFMSASYCYEHCWNELQHFPFRICNVSGFNLSIWKSKTISKTVTSMKGVETIILVYGLEDFVYLAELLGEVYDSRIEVEVFIDNKSLADSIKSTKLTEEKGIRVYISKIQQLFELKLIRRITGIPTEKKLLLMC